MYSLFVDHSHLTLELRQKIAIAIAEGRSKADIAKELGKDISTICKEIKRHRQRVYTCKLPLECANYKECNLGRHCTTKCPNYVPFKCKRRDRSPGVCNGCPGLSHCRFSKYKYSPGHADKEYRDNLVDSRQGVNLTVSEAKKIAEVLEPLLKHGLSPYSILQIHPELGICEKTLYNYIEGGVFDSVSDIALTDLRRQVSRKLRKKIRNFFKKREERKYLKGRLYKDYEEYIAENLNVFVTQMDTVYNDVTNGPFIQTFKFVKIGVILALYHESRTAEAMVAGVNLAESVLGRDLFKKYVEVLLTDRGTEFSDANALERSADGSQRTRVFYCDPLQPGQKGSLENKHIELRYILPKGKELKALGLTGQAALNLALSHVNSTPVESLGGKSPLELCEFLYPDLYERLTAFGIHKIDRDKIILRPYLLKDFR